VCPATRPASPGGSLTVCTSCTTPHRVELRANLDNVASLRVAEKAGFVREGVLRAAGTNTDGPCDLVVFGLLRADSA
jgi:RimJ/RimL family protein N-acetyltransferase